MHAYIAGIQLYTEFLGIKDIADKFSSAKGCLHPIALLTPVINALLCFTILSSYTIVGFLVDLHSIIKPYTPTGETARASKFIDIPIV